MKKFYLSFCFLFISTFTIFGQNILAPARQITNYNFDCRYPSAIQYMMNMVQGNDGLLFNAMHDSVANVCLLQFNTGADSFTTYLKITDNQYKNLYPVGFNYAYTDTTGEKVILWQTNQNGNWDIAASYYKNGSWSQPQLILNSPEDETHPTIILNWLSSGFQFLYQKGNSIYIYGRYGNIIKNKAIFIGNDTIKYSCAQGIYNTKLRVAAIKTINNSFSQLVTRSSDISDTTWTPEYVLYTASQLSDIQFGHLWNYNSKFSFNTLVGNKQRIMIGTFYNSYADSASISPFLSDDSIESSDLSQAEIPMITKNADIKIGSISVKTDYPYFFGPNSFKIKQNNSLYLVTNKYLYTNNDRAAYSIKFLDSKNFSGFPVSVWVNENYFRGFTVWEDSANGKINLFGVERMDLAGDVKPESKAVDYALYQNYPNPFNMTSVIKYYVNKPGNVDLRLYDVTGRLVRTLVDKKYQSGSQAVEWNGLNDAGQAMATGVYFYQLRVNDFVQTRKLLLLK